jgi:hypothetical protein
MHLIAQHAQRRQRQEQPERAPIRRASARNGTPGGRHEQADGYVAERSLARRHGLRGGHTPNYRDRNAVSQAGAFVAALVQPQRVIFAGTA